MSVNVVTKKDGKFSCETTEGSVVNITILQRSFWDALSDYANTTRTIQCEEPPTSSEKVHVLPITFGVSQFPLGVISIAMGIITSAAQIDLNDVYYSNAFFWIGIPFIISSLAEVMAYKTKWGIWVFLSFVCQLLIFSVSIAGLAFTESSRYSYWMDDPCMRLVANVQFRSYQAYDIGTDINFQYSSNSQILTNCQQVVSQFKDLKNGFLIMLLFIVSWGIISSIITVIYRLKSLFKCSRPYKKFAEENNEPLEKTPPYSVTV